MNYYDYLKVLAANSGLIFIVLMLFALSACSSTYQFGDVSRTYCMSENQGLRAIAKATLTNYGVNVGVDYCLIHGFIKEVKDSG